MAPGARLAARRGLAQRLDQPARGRLDCTGWAAGHFDAPANANDQLYKELGDDAPTSVAGSVGAGRYRWDIVLMDG